MKKLINIFLSLAITTLFIISCSGMNVADSSVSIQLPGSQAKMAKPEDIHFYEVIVSNGSKTYTTSGPAGSRLTIDGIVPGKYKISLTGKADKTDVLSLSSSSKNVTLKPGPNTVNMRLEFVYNGAGFVLDNNVYDHDLKNRYVNSEQVCCFDENGNIYLIDTAYQNEKLMYIYDVRDDTYCNNSDQFSFIGSNGTELVFDNKAEVLYAIENNESQRQVYRFTLPYDTSEFVATLDNSSEDDVDSDNDYYERWFEGAKFSAHNGYWT